jgi:hypothetical protein
VGKVKIGIFARWMIAFLEKVDFGIDGKIKDEIK